MTDNHGDNDNEIDLGPLLGREHPVPRRRWRWLLPLLVTLAVASLGAVAVAAVTRDTRHPAASVMGRYLDEVEAGDSVGAYGLLCDRFRADKPFDEFQRILTIEKREAGVVTDHKVARVEQRSAGTAVVSYTVRRQDGDVFVDAALVKERGAWRVCGFKTRGRAPSTTIGR